MQKSGDPPGTRRTLQEGWLMKRESISRIQTKYRRGAREANGQSLRRHLIVKNVPGLQNKFQIQKINNVTI
eukprot:6118841-Amphidinium_carterae.1